MESHAPLNSRNDLSVATLLAIGDSPWDSPLLPDGSGPRVLVGRDCVEPILLSLRRVRVIA